MNIKSLSIGNRVAAAMVLAVFVGGCAAPLSKNVLKVESPHAAAAGGLQIGFRQSNTLAPGYWAVVEPQGSGWVIKRISTHTMKIQSDSEEILYVSADRTWAQPAYEAAHDSGGCNSLGPSDRLRKQGIYTFCGPTRFTSLNVATTVAANAILAPLSLGLATGTNRRIDLEAVNEALKSSGLLEQVKQLEDSRQRMEAAARAYDQAYDKMVKEAQDAARYDVRVTDRTGLFKGSDELRQRFSLRPLLGSRLAGDQMTADAYHKVWPNAAALQGAFDASAERLKAQVGAQRSELTFASECNTRALGAFQLKISCPQRITIEEIDRRMPIAVPVEVVALGEVVLQPAFRHSDDSLEIQANGQNVQIANRSTSFIEVSEISCYADGEISSRKFPAGAPLTLPPQGELKPALARDQLCTGDVAAKLRLRGVTARDISGKSLRHGFAVKYRKAGEPTDRTLYQQLSSPLQTLVSMQL